VPLPRQASLPIATPFLRGATDARKPINAKANSTGHHQKASLHIIASPSNLLEFLEDPLPYLNCKWRQNQCVRVYS
jgi:hypothetical protein